PTCSQCCYIRRTRSMASLILFAHPPARTELYTLSLHDALPIWLDRRRRRTHAPHAVRAVGPRGRSRRAAFPQRHQRDRAGARRRDRKSTRLNSSHVKISYAVFCLKKKKNTKTEELREWRREA